jgi:multidrug efflux pump subunit AcrA (membrane-fusion protein)
MSVRLFVRLPVCACRSRQRRRASATPFLMTASLVAIAAAAFATGCGSSAKTRSDAAPAAAAVPVDATEAIEQPIARFIRVTGTLAAQEDAEVAAETSGRVIATPVELGTRVAAGAELIRLAASETEAQLKEAEANAAQIEARLGLRDGSRFAIDRVPEVVNAKASAELAQTEFDRIRTLLDQKVVSQAEFDQRRTQADAARQQYEIARNAAEQQFQALQAAQARVALARKALADTVVRAPFDGIVGQRLVSVGDYVTRGTKVATVVRANPLRLELTVPEQFVSEVAPGRPVLLQVDAYRTRTFTGQVRYVSPALRAESRALMVEAVVPNPGGELKPGFFATAQIEQAQHKPGVLVPSTAVQVVSGTARVFVLKGDRVEERIVTTGQPVGDLIEVTSGLTRGETIATTNLGQLMDGALVARR